MIHTNNNTQSVHSFIDTYDSLGTNLCRHGSVVLVLIGIHHHVATGQRWLLLSIVISISAIVIAQIKETEGTVGKSSHEQSSGRAEFQ